MSSPAASRIVVAYDNPAPSLVGGWAEYRIGEISVPVSINPDLREGADALLWRKVPHLHLVGLFRRPIVLADVKFATFDGYRAGCQPTGLLGIAEGERRDDCRFEAPPIAVKFNASLGEFHRLDTGRPVTRCPLLLLTPRGAYGHFPPPANTLQRRRQTNASL